MKKNTIKNAVFWQTITNYMLLATAFIIGFVPLDLTAKLILLAVIALGYAIANQGTFKQKKTTEKQKAV